ncbi:MAG TPA: amidohydrolase family protein [Flavisolibacter sp.]|nr:amidohydrolase family protein [Flavisolibacter sp.]
MLIDSHQHFWNFDSEEFAWITQEMSLIKKDFLPGDLKPILQEHDFDGCVTVQAQQSEDETNFLLKLAECNDFIKGVVGWADLQAENINERLAYFKQFEKLKGFRHVLQGEIKRDLMLSQDFKRGISLLNNYNFTYDILIFPDQLVFAKELVKEFPEQKFVIDHLAKPYIKDGKIEEWKKDMEAISSFNNVYCKISGMVTEADWKKWKTQDFFPYLDIIVNSFGTDRIMYGSDWPVCLVASSYTQALNILKEYFSSFSKDEQDLFFGNNAAKFYNLN